MLSPVFGPEPEPTAFGPSAVFAPVQGTLFGPVPEPVRDPSPSVMESPENWQAHRVQRRGPIVTNWRWGVRDSVEVSRLHPAADFCSIGRIVP